MNLLRRTQADEFRPRARSTLSTGFERVVDARAVRSSRGGGSMITFGVAGDVELLDPDGNGLSLAALP